MPAPQHRSFTSHLDQEYLASPSRYPKVTGIVPSIIQNQPGQSFNHDHCRLVRVEVAMMNQS